MATPEEPNDTSIEDAIRVDINASFSPMQLMATAVHEMFKSFRLAGFNEKQALHLSGMFIRFGQEDEDDYGMYDDDDFEEEDYDGED